MATIVQLSDTHLVSEAGENVKGVDTRSTLLRVLDGVARVMPSVELFVLTGDLAHDERESTYRLLRDLLGPRADRCRVVAGNHDDPAALARVFPDASRLADTVSFSLAVGSYRLVGLDSHVPGEVWGRIDREQLDWLANELAADASARVILFVHHPPVPVGRTSPDPVMLKNGPALADVIEASGRVEAIFHGHIHHELEGRFAGATVHAVPSTCFQFKPDVWPIEIDGEAPGFRVIELGDGRLRTRVVRVGPMAPLPP